MFRKRLQRQEPGDLIQAATINRIADAAEHAAGLRVAPPLTLQQTPGGPLLGVNVANARLAVADGNIPARVGSAAGVGKVKIVTMQATFSGGVMVTCTLTTSTIGITVYNPSSNTMTSGNGIDSGMYVWVQQDLSGFYAVFPLECS